MSVEIRMPKMGLTMTTGTVTRWLKKEGDNVTKGEEILEINTEKITNTVEAPIDGVLLKIIASEGEELPIGAVLGLIGEAGETIGEVSGEKPLKEDAAPAQAEKINTPAAATEAVISGVRKKITPAAAKLAKEINIDCNLLTGTGPGGRITREDVEKAYEDLKKAETKKAGQTEQRLEEKPVEKSLEQPVQKEIADALQPALEGPSFELLPYSGMRKAIGENMSRSWAIAPKVTHHVSIDATKLLELRKLINEDAGDDGKVSITDLIIKIVVRALQLRPNINVSLEGNNIKVFKDINIGVAVALEKGLVVPVIKNADKKSLFKISQEVRELAKKARENKLSLDDMAGGTFTITNLGAYGSVDYFTPIINQPQSAILGIGRIAESPAVVNGQVVPRPMMGLSLAFDHRVIDGAPAADFMAVLIKLMDQPLKAIV